MKRLVSAPNSMPQKPKKLARKRSPKPAKADDSKRSAQAQRKRQRLLDAAIEVLLEDGLAKFTSARIVEVAGLHKPAFYSVFKSADECLEAIAVHLAGANVRDVLSYQGKLIEAGAAGPTSGDGVLRHGHKVIVHMLQAVSQQKPLYRLLRRFKDQNNALGEAIRGIDAFVHERWEERFLRLAVKVGVDARHFREIGVMTHFIVNLNYEAAHRVLDGVVPDIEVEATRLERYVQAIVTSELKRMLSEPKPAP